MTKKIFILSTAVLSLILILGACGGSSAAGKWEVSVKTPFFGGNVINTTLTLDGDQVYDDKGMMIGTYEAYDVEGDDYLTLHFSIKVGGISGMSLYDGKFTDSSTVEGTSVTLKRKAQGDTLKGEWWKAKKVE